MRDFFKQEIQTLYAKTQLRQYETLSAMPDFEFQFKTLLDALCKVCEHFNYIPEQAQKSIILEQMLLDEDFIGFNAKIVSKWFNRAKDKYFVEEAHKPGKESNAKVVTYDELKPELKQAVDNLLVTLATDGSGIRPVPKVSQQELRSLEIEDEIKRGQAITEILSDPKLIEIHEKKMKAIRDRGLHKLDLRDLKRFEIEGEIIHARTEDEAREIYLEVYL